MILVQNHEGSPFDRHVPVGSANLRRPFKFGPWEKQSMPAEEAQALLRHFPFRFKLLDAEPEDPPRRKPGRPRKRPLVEEPTRVSEPIDLGPPKPPPLGLDGFTEDLQ